MEGSPVPSMASTEAITQGERLLHLLGLTDDDLPVHSIMIKTSELLQAYFDHAISQFDHEIELNPYEYPHFVDLTRFDADYYPVRMWLRRHAGYDDEDFLSALQQVWHEYYADLRQQKQYLSQWIGPFEVLLHILDDDCKTSLPVANVMTPEVYTFNKLEQVIHALYDTGVMFGCEIERNLFIKLNGKAVLFTPTLLQKAVRTNEKVEVYRVRHAVTLPGGVEDVFCEKAIIDTLFRREACREERELESERPMKRRRRV